MCRFIDLVEKYQNSCQFRYDLNSLRKAKSFKTGPVMTRFDRFCHSDLDDFYILNNFLIFLKFNENCIFL